MMYLAKSSENTQRTFAQPLIEEEEEEEEQAPPQRPPSTPNLQVSTLPPTAVPHAPAALHAVTRTSTPLGVSPLVSPLPSRVTMIAPQATDSAPRAPLSAFATKPSPPPASASPLAALAAKAPPPSLADMMAQAPTPVGRGSAAAAFIPSPGSVPTFRNDEERAPPSNPGPGSSRSYAPAAPYRAHEPGSLSQVKTECPALRVLPEFPKRPTVRFDPSANRPLAYVINQAPEYSVIQLPPGITITEELKVYKSVWLRGDNTTITSDGPSPTFATHAYVVFEGLRIAHTSSESGALSVTEGYVHIEKCTLTSPIVSVLTVAESAIVEVVSSDLFGSKNPIIHADGKSFVHITQSEIHGGRTHGIFLGETATAFVDNCRVYGNMGYGIGTVASSNLHCTKCDVYENDFTGFEIASTGYARIDRCLIHDEPSAGVHVLKQGVGVTVSNCEFSKCRTAAVHITEGAAGRVVSCILQGADGNCLAMANNYGILAIELSLLSGKAEAALACHDSGKIEATSLTIQQIDGGGALCYDSGILVMRDCEVSNVTKWGIQVRNGRTVELINVGISQAKLTGLVVSGRATGFARGCRVRGCDIGGEFANLAGFEVTNCDLSSNARGGIVCENAAVTFKNCTWNANGQLGAEIKAPQCEAVFDNCTLDANPVGILVDMGASAKIVGGTISGATMFGVSVAKGRLHAVQLTLTNIASAGISIGGKEAEVVCESCSIQNNDNYGVQAFDGAKCNFVQCLFSNFFDIFCKTEARVKCQRCTFEHSKQGHCDVKEGAKMSLRGCELSEGGHAIQVEAAVLKMRGTHISNEPQAAVLLCEGAVLKATASVFSGNGVCGLAMLEGARAELHQCQFLRNGRLGIQAKGGVLLLENCAVKNHAHVGIVCTGATCVTEVGTEYEGNANGNIVRQ